MSPSESALLTDRSRIPARPRSEARWKAVASLLGVMALVIVGGLLQQRSGLNPDVAWFLEVAERLGEGHALYRDAPGSALEVNPPLAIWTLVPAIRVATQLGAGITTAPAILVGIQAIISIALCVAIIRCTSRAARASLWFIAVAGTVLPAHDFAQREHQVVLLLAPYLLGLALERDGKQLPLVLRIAVGVCAGVGISLKPHFIGAWALCELGIALLDRTPRRLVRPEAITVVVVVSVYAVALLAITPEYLRMAEIWGPLYLRMNVRSLTDMLLRPESLFTRAALILAFHRRDRGPAGRIALTFAIAATAFLIAVFVQRKGFDYHYFPAFAFAVVSTLTIVCVWNRQTESVARALPAFALAAALLFLTLLRVAIGVVLGDENRRLTAAYGSAARARANDAVRDRDLVVLSTSLPHAFPMSTYLGLDWALRVPSLWALEPIAPRGCTAAANGDQAIERRFTDGVFVDLMRAMPRVVIDAPLPPGMRPRAGCMTVVDHLSREPRFAALFARYTPIDTIPRKVHGPFVVRERRVPAGPSREGSGPVAGRVRR